jgi:hypothetical protein
MDFCNPNIFHHDNLSLRLLRFALCLCFFSIISASI